MTILNETILEKTYSDDNTMEENSSSSNEDNSDSENENVGKTMFPHNTTGENSDKNNSDSEDQNSENSMIVDSVLEEKQKQNDSEESSSDIDSDSENENLGNAGWADAMCKVLNTNVPNAKNFILSKAKKDTDIKVKDKTEEIEMVDESGKVTGVKKLDPKPLQKTIKQKRKEMLEKRKQKAAWENMCRVKPEDRSKEKERELIGIATKGVMHLFNTVAKHQKNMKQLKDKKSEKKKSLGAVKGSFMDILKGHSSKQPDLEDHPVAKKVNQEETWSILKDNFMMGAEMKDWDKESDNE